MSNSKVRKPNVVRGGTAVPLGRNYYYMSGRKHETGGIDIGKNPRTGLEVEDGEVMHVGQNEIKVFSAQPFLNGKSPAQRVMHGDNPKTVFNAQERFKKRNKLNDDGTKKAARGGLYSVTINGITKLYPFPSTGRVHKATTTKPTKTAKRSKYRTGGDKEENTEDIIHFASPQVSPFSLREQTPNPVPRAFAKRNRHITNPKELEEAYKKETGQNPNWFKRTVSSARDYVKNNPNTIEDAIGLTSNIIGGLISHAANRKMLNNLKYSSAPAARTAAKLKTHININPQLDKMRESLAAYERDVDANTASSRVALARKQRARLASVLNTNELYADKENKETDLINKDRLNQQAVVAENIRDYNKWAESKAAFNRAVLEKKAENDVGLINTINAGVQNVLSNIDKRRSENKTIATMALANPDLPIELFYKEGIINKRVRDAYRKAYPIKHKKKD